MYQENPYLINPAFAGNKGVLYANLNYLHISSGYDGTPKIFSIGVHSPVYKSMSLGIRLYKQSEGLFENISGFADYSYQLKISDQQSIRFGIAAGFRSNQIRQSGIIAENPAEIINIASKNFVGFYFESAAGIGYNWKNLNLAFSVPHLFDSKYNFAPDYLTMLTYDFSIPDKSLILRPVLFFDYNPRQPAFYDIGIQALWREQFFSGISYRNRPAIVFSVGYQFQNLKLSYAVELGLNKTSNIYNQVHEISIAFGFKRVKPVYKDSLIRPTDSVIVDIHKIENVEPDSIPDGPLYKIEKAGNGIYVVKLVEIDSTNQLQKNELITDKQLSNLEKDSVMSENLMKNLVNSKSEKNYKVVSIGDGVFSIKKINGTSDSLQVNDNLTDAAIDSLIIADKILENFNISGQDDHQTEPGNFSIRMFIDESNMNVLRDAEIALNTWIETDETNKFTYYYGRFNTEEEALQNLDNLSKYNIETKIVRLSRKTE